MASSTASAATSYQVFLSFRGPDTRHGIVDVLYYALTDAGIRVFRGFRDADELALGDPIDRILGEIQRCRILVPIFSKTYASSAWCLRELTEMVESVEGSSGKMIIPIFYDVGVDDVKLKTNLYSEALKKHLERYGRDQVQQWEGALREVAKIKGWELKDTGHEQLARSFVREISSVLKVKHLDSTKYFVQMDDQVEALMKLLDIESSDVRFVGIFGIGGIGKTTLAKVVFNMLCHRFDSCSFLADVRESSQQHKGTEQLQGQLLSDLGVGMGEIMDVEDGITRMRVRLVRKKVLIVLDDVDHKKQIENLAGDATWFGSGSRIIITTRDQRVLEIEQLRNRTLEVKDMKPEAAHRLLCMHAFGKDSPPSDYLSLSDDVLASTGRLPLAVAVIGSYLRGKPYEFWANAIPRLKEVLFHEKFMKERRKKNPLETRQLEEALKVGELKRRNFKSEVNLYGKSASAKSAFAHFAEEDIVETYRPAGARELEAKVSDEDEEVDARANEFINSFMQQLKLERIDSIMRYKDMVNRGDTSSKNNSKFVAYAIPKKLKETHGRFLVGMTDQVEKLKKVLQDESRDVLLVGIHGLGGIGKTTLAEAVFDQLSTHFEASSFLRDIRETSKHKGLKYLQDQLLRDLIGADTESKTKTTRHSFLEKKVIVVLDDIDDERQIEKLVGRSNWFVSGSRIIVTTRDINVLPTEPETLHDDILKGPPEFKMEKMEPTEALELFCRHAFGEIDPPDNYQSICEQVVDVLGGLPLALEIIGSFLNHKPENVWNTTLEKLQNLPDQELHAILGIIYDELDLEAKEVFLDIACFFNGVEKTTPLYMWDACELLTKQGIEVLIFMSFVKVLDDNRLWMHDEVRDFGRNIARGVAITDSDKGSRFWTNQEVLDILRSNKVNEHVQGLRLRFDEFLKDCIFPPEGLGSDLPNLRFLDFSGFPLAVKLVLPKLRWLSWHFCPRNVKETDLCLKKLVILDLSKSGIDDQFCGSVRLKSAKNLKVLNLTRCKRITKTPRFSKCMILESLILEDCEKLVKIDSSIGKLKQLIYLNVKGCCSLEELPKELGSAKALTEIVMEGNGQSFKLQESTVGLTSLLVLEICNVKIVDALHIGNLERLEHLTFSQCSGMKGFPESAQLFMSLVRLDLSGSEITHLPDSIGEMRKLKVINIESSLICKLPESVGKLEKLEELHAGKCRDLRGKIPSEIGNLSSLRILDLSFTGISSLPSTLSRLYNLRTLNLESCHELKELPELPKFLVSLHVMSKELQYVPDLSDLTFLSDLKLSCAIDEFQADWFWKLSRLEKLELCIPRFTALEFGITSQLRSLSVSCRDVETLPKLPSTLSRLRLAHLKGNTEFTSLCHLERLTFLELIRCSMGDGELRSLGIVESKSLEHLYASKCNFSTVSGPWLPARLRLLSLKSCKLLDGLLDLSELENLILLELMDCRKLSELRGLGELEALEEIVICNCKSLVTLGDLSKLQKLEVLQVEHCPRFSFSEVEGLERIESLNHIKVLSGRFPETSLRGSERRPGGHFLTIVIMLSIIVAIVGRNWTHFFGQR